MLRLGMASQVIHFALSSGRSLVFCIYIYIYIYTHTLTYTYSEKINTQKAKKIITTKLLRKYWTLEEFQQARYTHSKTFNIMPNGLLSLLMVNLVRGWWTPYQQLTNHIFFWNKPVMHQVLYFLPNYNIPLELHRDFEILTIINELKLRS